MIQRLNNKLFPVTVVQDYVQSELDVLAFVDLRQEGGNLAVVSVNTFEQVVESLDNLQVGLFEGLVELDKFDGVLDLFIVKFLLLDIV